MHFKKTYPTFHLDCDLDLKPGTITGLIGRNGSGKTTIFKLLMGLIRDDENPMKFLDKTDVAVVWTNSTFSLWFTIQDIQKILKSMYPKFDSAYFEKQIQHFDLNPKMSLKEYSTGMLSKLKVVIATSIHAKILLLDEPTSGMDVIARNEVLDLLRDYMIEQEESSILISSHISSDLESLCDEFYFLEDGTLLFHESSDSLLENYAILKIEEDKNIDLAYVLKRKDNHFLTNQKQFYVENYPNMVIENIHLDTLMEMMLQGADI